jgi:hypothetical protein
LQALDAANNGMARAIWPIAMAVGLVRPFSPGPAGNRFGFIPDLQLSRVEGRIRNPRIATIRWRRNSKENDPVRWSFSRPFNASIRFSKICFEHVTRSATSLTAVHRQIGACASDAAGAEFEE